LIKWSSTICRNTSIWYITLRHLPCGEKISYFGGKRRDKCGSTNYDDSTTS